MIGMGKGIAEALVAGGAETYALDIIEENLDKLKSEVLIHEAPTSGVK